MLNLYTGASGVILCVMVLSMQYCELHSLFVQLIFSVEEVRAVEVLAPVPTGGEEGVVGKRDVAVQFLVRGEADRADVDSCSRACRQVKLARETHTETHHSLSLSLSWRGLDVKKTSSLLHYPRKE